MLSVSSALDLFPIIMEKLLAVVNLTYKEAIHKRIFLIVVLFTIILISSSAFSPSAGSAERVQLVEIWVLRGISFFGMVIAIFLAAVSIPSDIEYKRIFSVLTKPISKETFLLGKFLGFVVVLAFFVFALGLIGLIYLKAVDFITSPGQSYVTAPIEKIKPVEFEFYQRGSITSEFTGTYEKEQGLKVTLQGEGNNYGEWHFKNLDQYHLTDPVQCEITARISKGFKISADISLIFHNPHTKHQETRRVRLTYKKPLIVEFDKSYIDASGQLWVIISSLEPKAKLTLQPDSLVILTASKSFTWNFIKSLGLILLQIILILSIMIAGSTVLSGSVNALLGIFVYFVGSLMGFLKESLIVMERALETTQQMLAQPALHAHAPPDTLPLWMMKTSEFILNLTFKFMPDLSNFDGTTPLLNNIFIQPGLIGAALAYLLLYTAVALIVGWFCFHWRQFK